MCAGCSINGRDFFSASPGRCRRLENSSNVQFIKKINCFLEGRTYRHRVPSVGYRDCGVGGWDQRLCVPSLEASSVFTICAAEARASPPSMSWHSRSVHQSHRQEPYPQSCLSRRATHLHEPTPSSPKRRRVTRRKSSNDDMQTE
ncbi:uncharacterized protein [Zea mays]|uniref:uncharacterized protein isoform X1 n=1 Tax=Zea mays TaxID=4577 RepID=UPI0009AAC188|nr:uncharacterized protein LOC103654190 isoform X1 [Zea mays]|eukprot:XP_020408324.1 uncharacterized protein LOC103654190 isoform X1 [Zea mays]